MRGGTEGCTPAGESAFTLGCTVTIGHERLHPGDVAILVERDEFLASTAFTNVKVWTLDGNLGAYS
ncbi:MAG: hypothetical protein Q4F67_10375 [Propionibacteriaceae bacterium]|nr:hypothetical protein [Propionibacteriaceae bacterium]